MLGGRIDENDDWAKIRLTDMTSEFRDSESTAPGDIARNGLFSRRRDLFSHVEDKCRSVT